MDSHDSIVFLKKIQSDFKRMKVITVAAVTGCVALCVIDRVLTFAHDRQNSNYVYVVDQGTVIGAQKAAGDVQRDLEAETHLRRFHELFFNISPNTETINSNMNQALALADESAFEYFSDLKEHQYYAKMIQNNCSQQVKVDSVLVDMNSRPYRAAVLVTRYYIRESNISKYRMVTTCTLHETPRSRTNPNGFIIKEFIVKSDELQETRKRK